VISPKSKAGVQLLPEEQMDLLTVYETVHCFVHKQSCEPSMYFCCNIIVMCLFQYVLGVQKMFVHSTTRLGRWVET